MYDEEISLRLRYQRGPKLLPENVHSAEVVGGRERCRQLVEIVKRVCNLLLLKLVENLRLVEIGRGFATG